MKEDVCSKCGKKAKMKLDVYYFNGKQQTYYLCGLCHYNFQRAKKNMLIKFFKEAYKEI